MGDWEGIIAVYKGQTFRKDDLVHIFVGTEAGVRAKKTEPMQAKFKGVKGELFLCRPVIGSQRGPCPSYPQWSVHKVQAFGAHVVGNRSARCFSRMSPVMQER
jgi:hypothetical protein